MAWIKGRWWTPTFDKCAQIPSHPGTSERSDFSFPGNKIERFDQRRIINILIIWADIGIPMLDRYPHHTWAMQNI
jgi:hypothetical protein